MAACAAAPARVHTAHLARDARAFAALRHEFVHNNPGYDLAWHPACRELAPCAHDRVVFVQAVVGATAELGVGDVVLVRAGQRRRMAGDAAFDLLAFSLPQSLPAELPATIRPDWDERITDTPGGCATDPGAYRRIVLTWQPEKGPYILHALNAHRVRIDDSFSHYHPLQGGFDEFYLVQAAGPQAQLLTSSQVAAIEAHDVTPAQAATLLRTQTLHAGELVYLPRGTMHRGLGGAVVQVISVPGFVPNAEIGVDHHLWAINRKLALQGEQRLPFHLVAARTKVVK